jgi:hypothetical protein
VPTVAVAANSVDADVDLRDLAFLESTTLLFAEGREADRHFPVYPVFYDGALQPSGLGDRTSLPASVRNTLCLLETIRAAVTRTRHPESYPLMVFDAVLM